MRKWRKTIAVFLILFLLSPLIGGILGSGIALGAEKSFTDHLSFILKGLLMMWLLKYLTGDYLLGTAGEATPPDSPTITPDSSVVEIIEEPVNPDQTQQVQIQPRKLDGVTSLTGEEKKMVELINNSRKEHGLPPLEVDMRIIEIARRKAQDMVENNYFAHNSPVMGTPGEMVSAEGINFVLLGENLGQGRLVEEVHRAWMKSPDHRMNILDTRFTHVGVGVASIDATSKMFVQIFIQFDVSRGEHKKIPHS